MLAILTATQEVLGGNNTSVQSNYFGKGNTTAYDRGGFHDLETPTDTFHKYAFEWTNASMTWIIDGTPVRTLNYSDALGGKNFPQTPSRLSLGVWSAGTHKQAEGTVQWAGGYTDFDEAPFTMYVRNVKIINYNPGMNYNWTDTTGDFSSINVINETVAINSSSADPLSASNSDSASSTSSASSSNGTPFSQNGASAASSLLDSAWIIASTVSFVGFAVGFSLL